MDIFLDNLRQLTPKQHSMPISMVRNLCTILQCIATLCRSQTNASNSYALVNITHLGL